MSFHVVEGKFFHSALRGSLAGLINKLIKDRLTGKKKTDLISYVWEPMQTCDAKAAGQLKFISHPELRNGIGAGTSKGRRAIHRRKRRADVCLVL